MTKFQGKIMVGAGDLVATVDNQSYHVTKAHPMYRDLLDAYKTNDADKFTRLCNVKHCMETYATGESIGKQTGIKVDGERVYYNGTELNNAIVDTIRTMMQNRMDFKPMVKFLERAIKTGSKRILDELFKFLQVCRCTITEDGCFLAYKTVRADYFDKYSGKFKNEVGTELRMERWEVDDNCNNACSKGFHVGALAYAGPGGTYNSSGDKVLIVKVAPEDVVSVPYDHSCQKMRVCAYTVVGEFQGELQPSVYSGRVGGDYSQPLMAHQKAVEIEPEDMVVDGVYRAEYYSKSQGHSRQRYFVVLERYNDYVLVELMEPEDNAGSVRRFNFDKLSNIYEWDGNRDWEDDYEEEDDECCDCDCDDEDYDDCDRSSLDYW